MRLKPLVSLTSPVTLAVGLAGCQASSPIPERREQVAPTRQARASQDDPDRPGTLDEPAPTLTPPPEGELLEGMAPVDSLNINMMESFPVQVMAVVSGHLADDCTSISGSQQSRLGVTSSCYASSHPGPPA